MDRVKALIEGTQWMPFLLAAGTHPTLSPARLIESVIIASMAGVMSVWATTIVIQKDIEYIKQSQAEARVWYGETKQQIHSIERYLYTHTHIGKKHE